MITTISKLKVGQRFRFVPDQWFGEAKLIYKKRRENAFWSFEKRDIIRNYLYDIKFDAAVVNPPGIEYGLPSDTKVKVLKRKKK